MRSLWLKLLLAFAAVSLVGTAILGVVASRAISTQFGSFVTNQRAESLAAELAAYYSANGSWAGVADRISFLESAAPFGAGNGQRSAGMGNGGMGMTGSGGYELVDNNGNYIAGFMGQEHDTVDAETLATGIPVVADGQQVGLLIAHHSSSQQFSAAGVAFLNNLRLALFAAALGATILAVGLAVWLARTLTRPLGELTEAASAVSRGDLSRSVVVGSDDEVGRLGQAFNRMTEQLARAQETRRQMTADIAHELRTPLTVILGHSEAMLEKVLPASAENLELVHDEAQRLSRLVEDLRMLSLAEAGELKLELRPVKLDVLLEKALAKIRPLADQKSVGLHLDVEAGLPGVNLDQDRMEQVIGNLLNNALRHSPARGQIRVAAQHAGEGLRISVADDGPGIAAEDLPRIFERFYRADKARQRDQGGAGLGLAISRSIVEAHGGRIWAESPPGQGAHMCIELPMP